MTKKGGTGGSAYLGPRRVRALTKSHCLTSYFMTTFTLVLFSVLANELHVDLMLNPMLNHWKPMNLQPEIEIKEYSSSKKLLEYFTTRVVLEYSRQP